MVGIQKQPPIRMPYFSKATNENSAFLKMQHSDWWRFLAADPCGTKKTIIGGEAFEWNMHNSEGTIHIDKTCVINFSFMIRDA